MKNQEQGSPTQMVGQNAYRFPVSDTVQAILTPRQAERMAQYLDMLKAVGGVTSGAVPAVVAPTSAEQSRREARARIQAKQAEHREARRERRAQVQAPKATGPQTVTTWLARECEELAELVEGMPANLEDAQRRLHGARSARVKIQALAATLTPPERPSADEVAGEGLAGLIPTRGKGAGTEGPVRLWRLLHLVAVYKAESSGHHPSARQEVIHSAAELLAVHLQVCPRTVARWTAQLEGAGCLQARAHYTDDRDADTGEVITRIDGTVYAVALHPGHVPHLTYQDLHHRYRNLTADRHLGRTAFRYAKLLKARQDAEKNMSGSMTSREGGAAEPQHPSLQVLKAWTVTPGGGAEFLDSRYSVDPDIIGVEAKTSLQTVIYDLPLLGEAHDPRQRQALVSTTAARIAAALDDDHSRAYYAGLLWQALKDGWKGLQALAAQLARLEVDRREWGGHMRNPAAIWAARQRPA